MIHEEEVKKTPMQLSIERLMSRIAETQKNIPTKPFSETLIYKFFKERGVTLGGEK